MEEITGFRSKVHDNLEYLAKLDSYAWQSFKLIKEDDGPSPYNFLKAISIARRAKEENRPLNPYGFWLITTFCIAVFAVITTGILFLTFLILLPLSLVGLFRSWFPYQEEYLRQKSGREHPLSYAFGTHNASAHVTLFSTNFVEMLSVDDKELLPRIKSKDFDALIKLNKAAQEKEDVNFGIAEVVKKSTYGALLLALVKLDFSSVATTLEPYSAFASNITIQDKPVSVWLYLAVIFVCVTYLAYDLFLGQSKLKRKKKQYLVLLNVLKESWVDPTELSPPKVVDYSIDEQMLLKHLSTLRARTLIRLVWSAIQK